MPELRNASAIFVTSTWQKVEWFMYSGEFDSEKLSQYNLINLSNFHEFNTLVNFLTKAYLQVLDSSNLKLQIW